MRSHTPTLLDSPCRPQRGHPGRGAIVPRPGGRRRLVAAPPKGAGAGRRPGRDRADAGRAAEPAGHRPHHPPVPLLAPAVRQRAVPGAPPTPPAGAKVVRRPDGGGGRAVGVRPGETPGPVGVGGCRRRYPAGGGDGGRGPLRGHRPAALGGPGGGVPGPGHCRHRLRERLPGGGAGGAAPRRRRGGRADVRHRAVQVYPAAVVRAAGPQHPSPLEVPPEPRRRHAALHPPVQPLTPVPPRRPLPESTVTRPTSASSNVHFVACPVKPPEPGVSETLNETVRRGDPGRP